MKKVIGIVCIILVGLTAGCNLIPRFQQAEEQYLGTRVDELLEEMPEEEAATPEPEVTGEEKAVVPTAEPEEIEEVEEPTDESEVEETPEATEEPTAEPTPESDDPGVYLGDPDWVDEMNSAEFWVVGSDDYSSASFENGKFKVVALSEEPGWRIAGKGTLAKAYIEAKFENGKCADTDRFGLIFRIPANTGYNQGYIFSIACDGRYSLRMWDGLKKQSTWLMCYTANAEINSGSNQTNRLGVMTLGSRLMLFINGVKVDEISDDSFENGNFGVYLNRDKTENLTVYVDDVKYWVDPEEK